MFKYLQGVGLSRRIISPHTFQRCLTIGKSHNSPVSNDRKYSQFATDSNESAALKEQLLNLAIDKYLPIAGWSTRCVELAANELGFSASICGVVTQSPKIIPLKHKALLLDADLTNSGEQQNPYTIPQALVLHFLDRCNVSLGLKLETIDTTGLRIPEKIRKACIERLSLVAPYINCYDEALATIASSPRASVQCFSKLLDTVDDMWYFAGDTSVDLSWYSKRLTLAGVYSSTELYWIQMAKAAEPADDHSIPEEVLGFLDRRLEDVGSFGKWRSQMENGIQTWISTIGGVIQPMKRD